jgi:protocatechuate 3,4-dioxygenase alpha subunit
MSLIPTASQTIGPFFSIGLARLCDENSARADVVGERAVIAGTVWDGDGAPVPDALLEIWHADASGKYAIPANASDDAGAGAFRGFGRAATNEHGKFRFATVKPGGVRDADGMAQAPHIVVSIFMRGLLNRLVTRIYFADEPGNAADPVLHLVPAERRGTLMARASAGERGTFEWNVRLQGAGETVFFEL